MIQSLTEHLFFPQFNPHKKFTGDNKEKYMGSIKSIGTSNYLICGQRRMYAWAELLGVGAIFTLPTKDSSLLENSVFSCIITSYSK
jgi:hypothetical protein